MNRLSTTEPGAQPPPGSTPPGAPVEWPARPALAWPLADDPFACPVPLPPGKGRLTAEPAAADESEGEGKASAPGAGEVGAPL